MPDTSTAKPDDQVTNQLKSTFLWWIIDPVELKKQVDGYQTLSITKSARGQSLLLLALSAAATTGFILYFKQSSFNFIDVVISLTLGILIYRGQKWASLVAMGYWTLSKILNLPIFSGTTVSLIAVVLFWVAYMKAFWLAYQTEKARQKSK